jgi:hypothetical protein
MTKLLWQSTKLLQVSNLKAASSKMTKYEKACSDNQHVFIPFAFNTFSFLASNVVNLLKIVQKVMHSNILSHKSMNVVF